MRRVSCFSSAKRVLQNAAAPSSSTQAPNRIA
jgi:hypothetical protein